MDCSPPGPSVHGESPGNSTGLGSPALLQGIFPTQGSNLRLLCFVHCRRLLYLLSCWGKHTHTCTHTHTHPLTTVLCWVTQPCLTLCDPADCSLPGSSVHGIFQARTLEWVSRDHCAVPLKLTQCCKSTILQFLKCKKKKKKISVFNVGLPPGRQCIRNSTDRLCLEMLSIRVIFSC